MADRDNDLWGLDQRSDDPGAATAVRPQGTRRFREGAAQAADVPDGTRDESAGMPSPLSSGPESGQSLDAEGVRQKDLMAVLATEGTGADRLIEVLQQLQERRGHLDDRSLELVAQHLNLSPSRVFGVVSFYHLFRRTPPPLHGCRLCQGTACVVQGGWELRRQLERELRASDWGLSLESCLGVCGQAPMLLLDGVLVGRLPVQDPAAVRAELQRRGLPLRNEGMAP